MTKDEDIASYMLWVQQFFSSIYRLGGDFKERKIVKKALRSLPKSYSHKVSSIEQSKNWITIQLMKCLVLLFPLR